MMSNPNTKIPWMTANKIWLVASTLTLSLLIPSTFTTVNAFEVGEDKAVFLAAPRLTRTAATNLSANGPSTYHFTIQVPADAGEPIRAVRITQQPNLEKIDFVVERTSAFQGDSFAGGPSLSLNSIGGAAPDSNEVTLEFEKPVQPGETVTVALKAKNPRLGGVYQFGIEAFPSGENSPGLYLGSAYLRFNLSN